MKTTEFLTSYWHLNILSIVIGALLLLFHFISNGKKFTSGSTLFLGGLLLFILTTTSPLEFLGQYYLLSAHMIQHVLLLLVIPPLLLAGTKKEYFEKAFQNKILKNIGDFLFQPIIAWIIGVGSMWLFHIPALVMTVHSSMILMNLQNVILLLAGFIFIWPVLAPFKWKKLEPLQGAVYLFFACVCCTVLGIIIVFAPVGMFNSHMNVQNPLILELIQTSWGITPELDQQVGGLIMWVPTCVVYLTIILIIMIRWLISADTKEVTDKKVLPEI